MFDLDVLNHVRESKVSFVPQTQNDTSSYILNVVGDIYTADKNGVINFTTIHSADTLIDILQPNDSKDTYTNLFFKFRLAGRYLKASANMSFDTTAIRDQEGTRFSIEPATGRIVDAFGNRYEAIVKNISIQNIVAGGSPPPVVPPKPNDLPQPSIDKPRIDPPTSVFIPPAVTLKPDERGVSVRDYETPDNYNRAPSDPNYHWDARSNVENYFDPKTGYTTNQLQFLKYAALAGLGVVALYLFGKK